MKTRILLLLVITVSACASIVAQTDGELREVTLYWFAGAQTDRSRSSVNFETGMRGVDRAGSYDLRYGGMIIGTPTKPGEVSKVLADWLGVLDCRSMMVDLGAKQWQDFKETPMFPKPKTLEPPRPLGEPICAVNTSAGRTDFSPYRQYVVVNPGHVYLMRLFRESKVRYVMFRVESHKSRDHCVLSWKLVKPPNVDDNEK
ncbi:MAG TPA: hypothetical protein VIT19_06465 [Pyrinomonadaceae bacterium]